jgi:circadian clock protein KaiC
MADDQPQVKSGIPELDKVLRGGYVTGRMYLVYGAPGTGKTLLSTHFLEAGLRNGETVLFIHGEESQAELLVATSAVDIDIEDAAFLDLGPESDFFTREQSYDLVDPSEIERDKFTRDIHTAIEEIDPDRVVIDPITQLQYVEANEAQFRRQIVSFLRFLKGRDITVVTTATMSESSEYDTQLKSLSDGVIEVSREGDGRRLEVVKHRTVGQVDGTHGMEIRDSGIEVFPSLVPEQHDQSIGDTQIPAGIDELDSLLGGGLEENTVTFISGPTGVGKTTIGTRILTQAAVEDTACVYLFEESVDSFVRRSEALGIPVTDLREDGQLLVRAVEPLARSAEEFASIVREDVAEHGIEAVLIDGIDGYTMAIQGERDTLVHKLHSLSRHLTNDGVTVLVTDEISGITGVSSATSTDASYIADNILVLSYIEMDSRLRRVIGVLKKRTGRFEDTLREFELTADGITVGEPLAGVTGILQGTPETVETPHDTYQ